MSNKMLQTIKCFECEKEFIFGGQDVERQSFIDKDGQEIFVLSIKCNHCGHIHYVQVDNFRTEQMKSKLAVLMVQMSKSKLDYLPVKKQQLSKFNKLNRKLTDLRMELMKYYQDSKVTNTLTGEEVELRFTFV